MAAVENEPHACATRTTNHPDIRAVYQQDIRAVSDSCLQAAADMEVIDLLAGCPPCQGFTSLTAKYRRVDPRNALIHEMTRLIAAIRPRAVMMENVPGLAHRGWPLLERFLADLR